MIWTALSPNTFKVIERVNINLNRLEIILKLLNHIKLGRHPYLYQRLLRISISRGESISLIIRRSATQGVNLNHLGRIQEHHYVRTIQRPIKLRKLFKFIQRLFKKDISQVKKLWITILQVLYIVYLSHQWWEVNLNS